ncbi:MAG: DUF2442 domain-containing protein [Synechococcales cyanobacterium K44_A2020_017]|nr:DUF2442 domain-containing protein [Synechococcales cyanobacterium K32_A2020_035]MBF2095641.1 DUF2442 domain-containing protein [Synechococcales cyanobacterium K44_A2020_017]
MKGDRGVILAFQEQFERAQSSASQANRTEPRAISAAYDSALGLVTIQLQSGAIFSFPAAIAQGLAGAEPDALAQVEVTPMGDGLHWPTLDADFSVTGLLAGMFGTPRWMADLQQRQAS